MVTVLKLAGKDGDGITESKASAANGASIFDRKVILADSENDLASLDLGNHVASVGFVGVELKKLGGGVAVALDRDGLLRCHGGCRLAFRLELRRPYPT